MTLFVLQGSEAMVSSENRCEAMPIKLPLSLAPNDDQDNSAGER
jgi:hypothetical protein